MNPCGSPGSNRRRARCAEGMIRHQPSFDVEASTSSNSSMLRSAIAWIRSITSGRGFSPNKWLNRRCRRRYSSTGTSRRIGVVLMICPKAPSKSGKSPLSCARRASLIVSADADPHPSGQGTSTWRYHADSVDSHRPMNLRLEVAQVPPPSPSPRTGYRAPTEERKALSLTEDIAGLGSDCLGRRRSSGRRCRS